MKDKEILIHAISKAINNGCEYCTYKIDIDLWIEKKIYFNVIFDHDFVKAFFGTNLTHPKHGIDYGKPNHNIYGAIEAWKYHLPKMVMEKEPLRYLEKFL